MRLCLYALAVIVALSFLAACGQPSRPEPTYAEVQEQLQIKRAYSNIIKVCVSGDKIGRDPESNRLVLNPMSPAFGPKYFGTLLGPDANAESICQ